MRCLLSLSLAAVLIGCPTSDDIVQITDFGNARHDILLDTGTEPVPDEGTAPPKPDAPEPQDLGPAGCTTDAQCAGQLALDPCQVAVCDVPSGQCQPEAAPDGAPCDDGDACTLTECKSGTCFKTGEVTCADSNDCTADICDPDNGCQSVPQFGTPCDDGDECTLKDKCVDGACVGEGASPACSPTGTESDPATSCAQLLAGPHNKGSGVYWLRPADATFKTWCDMTTMGGGWARVANIRGEVPICSYGDGYGSVDDLVKDTAQTGIMPAAQAKMLAFAKREVLVVFSDGDRYAFKSSHLGFTWEALATGAVNAGNIGDFNIQGSTDGTAWVPVTFKGCKSELGACLLGGNHGSTGEYGVVLGIGAYHGATALDQNCKTISKTNTGLLKGKAAGANPAWGAKGAVYVR